MAQIVCIDTGTKRDNNEIGDIVAMHEDDVVLTISGYATFKVIQVKGFSVNEVQVRLATQIENRVSKYGHNMTVTTKEESDLGKEEISVDDKNIILEKITAKV